MDKVAGVPHAPPRARRVRPAAVAALLALAALAAACADQSQRDAADMLGLLALLPGHYDNSAQVDLEARSGARPAHVASSLVILHVYTPRLGQHVYFAQEAASDDPRRIFSQKMYSFKVEEKRGIVETLYEFNDPRRWRDGLESPDMFTGLVIEDVQAEACRLYWRKTATGYAGAHDPKVCPDAPGGAPARAQLAVGSLTLGDFRFLKSR